MGRAKKTAIYGKLRLKYPKSNYDTSKAYTIYYEYNYDRQIIRKAAPFKAKVKDWSEKANNGKGGLLSSYGDDYTRDTKRMLHHLSEVDDKIRVFSDKNPGKLNADIIRSLLHNAPLTREDGGRDFVDFVKEVLKERLRLNKMKYSTHENSLSNMRIFQEFLRATNRGTYKYDSIYLGEISGEIIGAYIDYRRHIKKNGNATINHSLTPIIFACKEAALQRLIPVEVYNKIASMRVEPDSLSIDDTGFDGKYLTLQELQQLVDFYNKDVEPRRKEYIEMFLFAFHAGGLRLVDVMTLQWKHIDFKKKEIKKVLIKTRKSQKQRNTNPLTPPAIQILNKWQEMGRRERYVFDLVDDDFDYNDPDALYHVRNSVDKKVNQALKVVGIKMGLPFTLHFHCARHSFAINALNRKKGDGGEDVQPMSVFEVSRLLGHASTSITERVYAEFLSETLEEKMNSLNFDGFIPVMNASRKKE